MTHSVTKSFLSSVVGIAFDRGMIRSIDDTVREYVAPIQLYNPTPAGNKSDRMGSADLLDLFDTPHNRTITWDHLLRQTSDWEGTLWGKPDWADRPERQAAANGSTRPRNKPGTRLQVQRHARERARARRAERLAPPAAAGAEGKHHGPDRRLEHLALVRLRELLGRARRRVVQSVTGGGHWGGGMFINAYDMARFGLLTLRRGQWGDRQLLSEQWVALGAHADAGQPPYGFMNWYLNTDRKPAERAGDRLRAHRQRPNMIYVDPEHDLVAVVRWIDNDAADGFVKRLIAAMADKS